MMEMLQHSTTLWVAISFVVFVLFAVKFGSKGILAALDSKIAAIRADIDTAARLKQEAQDLLAEFQVKQQEAEKTAATIIEQAKASARAVQQAAESELTQSLARREAQLTERLKRIEQQAIADIQNHAADLTIRTTREIVTKTVDEKTGGTLLDQSIQSLTKYLN